MYPIKLNPIRGAFGSWEHIKMVQWYNHLRSIQRVNRILQTKRLSRTDD